jgi:hypothetical protein
MQKLNVRELVVPPKGARVIPSKWAYDIKRDGVFKARFVARGDKQRPGTDYADTFANVVRPETLRLILAIVCILGLCADCVDIMTAFLNTLMKSDQPVFLAPPPGHKTYDKQGRLLVWLLLRAMYGLKQSNRLWYLTLIEFFKQHGFYPLPSDPCILRNARGDILVLWVDDIAIISSTQAGVQEIKNIISSQFDIRDLGELAEYLGLDITRDKANRRLYLTQHTYIKRILHRYHMEDVTPVPYPASTTEMFYPNTGMASKNQTELYQAMLGSAMYAAVWTRPDIAERCSRLGSFASNPLEIHESALQRLFRYLKGTMNVGICYSAVKPRLEVHSLQFVGFSDSSYADRSDMKSTSGYLFKLAGGPVSWKSRKQSVTATYSTEAEYIAYSIATKEAVWLRRVLLDLEYEFPDVQKVLLFGDNKPALSLTTNPAHHSRTKHILVPFHYVREQVEQGIIHVEYLPTHLMPADGLTKPLTGIAFQRFVKMLGLLSTPLSGDAEQSGGVLDGTSTGQGRTSVNERVNEQMNRQMTTSRVTSNEERNAAALPVRSGMQQRYQ